MAEAGNSARAEQVRRLEKLLERVGRGSTEALRRTRAGSFLLDLVSAAMTVAHGFRGEKISLRASALTYITILSLVPMLAVAFAIVRAIGQDSLRERVQEFIFSTMAPGTREQTSAYLGQFIDNASSGALGGLGGGFLLISAVSLLNNIERSLNEIWGVSRSRSLVQRGLIYWCVLTLGPVLLGFSLVATGTVQSMVNEFGAAPRLLTLIPMVTTVMGFSLLYIIAPNARVSFRAALGGGMIAGLAWELAKHGYALYASRAIQYSAIYGSLGAVPLFLVWVYVSWLLVLFGARLAYALQYAAGRSVEAKLTDPRSRELLCARVALAAAQRFVEGGAPPRATELARSLSLDEGYVRDAIRVLLEAGLLAETPKGGLVPARPPDAITLLDVARAANGTLFGHARGAPSPEALSQRLAELFARADEAGESRLGSQSLASLLAVPGARAAGNG